MCADDWVPCGELEEDLRVTVGQFAGVCRREGLKVNAGKSKGEVHVGGIRLERVSEFKYLGCVLDTIGPECSRKVVSYVCHQVPC